MDADNLRDIFEGFGPVRIRRMFGGYGIYADDLMFALAAGDELYLKADSETEPHFESEGSTPFTYATKNGRTVVMSYWRAPDRLFDDRDDMAQWAGNALAAARRAALVKSRKRKK